jgi:hypothetical protein
MSGVLLSVKEGLASEPLGRLMATNHICAARRGAAVVVVQIPEHGKGADGPDELWFARGGLPLAECLVRARRVVERDELPKNGAGRGPV